MKIAVTAFFRQDYDDLPAQIRKKVDRQVNFLADNLRHPGLRAKHIKGQTDIWEARIDRFYRFSFKIEGDIIYLRRVGPHDKTLNNP